MRKSTHRAGVRKIFLQSSESSKVDLPPLFLEYNKKNGITNFTERSKALGGSVWETVHSKRNIGSIFTAPFQKIPESDLLSGIFAFNSINLSAAGARAPAAYVDPAGNYRAVWTVNRSRVQLAARRPSHFPAALPRRTSPPHFPTALPHRSPHSGQAGGRAQLGNRPLFSAAERVLTQDRRAASQTGRKRRELLRPDQPLSPALSSPPRRSPARRKGPALPNWPGFVPK